MNFEIESYVKPLPSEILLDNNEKILENRQLALAILSEEQPELSEEKILALLNLLY